MPFGNDASVTRFKQYCAVSQSHTIQTVFQGRVRTVMKSSTAVLQLDVTYETIHAEISASAANTLESINAIETLFEANIKTYNIILLQVKDIR